MQRDYGLPDMLLDAGVTSAFLRAVVDRIRETAQALFGPHSPILETLAYHVEGGKRLRALLPALVARRYGVDPSEVVPFAAACEALHNATLVHDDLQDGDELRRGQLTVWRRFGEARAINLGDALIVLSYTLIGALPPSGGAQALRRLSAVCASAIDAQEREQLATALPSAALSVDRVLAIAEGKTAGLFALPLVGAAELCGAPAGEIAALEQCAQCLGVFFQVQDDVLDLLALKAGRPARRDLVEGKRSVLVALACERLPRPRADALLAFLDLPSDAKTAPLLRAHADTLHATLDEAYELLAGQRQGARDAVDGRWRGFADELLTVLAHPDIARALDEADSAIRRLSRRSARSESPRELVG